MFFYAPLTPTAWTTEVQVMAGWQWSVVWAQSAPTRLDSSTTEPLRAAFICGWLPHTKCTHSPFSRAHSVVPLGHICVSALSGHSLYHCCYPAQATMGWFEKLYAKGCSASGAAKEEQAKALRQNVRSRRPVV